MALQYSFQISTRIDMDFMEKYFISKAGSFSKEMLSSDVYLYGNLNPFTEFIVFFSYRNNTELFYTEDCLENIFVSEGVCTRFTIRLNKFVDLPKQDLDVYDMISHILTEYSNDCCLVHLGENLVFERINGKFSLGKYADNTPFKVFKIR